jgi:hypothetical protein
MAVDAGRRRLLSSKSLHFEKVILNGLKPHSSLSG